MKISVILLACLLLTVSTKAQWNLLEPLPDNTYDIQFISSTTGFLVGNSGTILKTTTSGNSWTIRSGGITFDLRGVFFLNELKGTVVGASGKVFQTTDSGITWTLRTTGTTSTLYDVFFVNDSTGFVSGSGGTILKTTDGGINWEQKNSGTTYTVENVWFTDPMNGCAVSYNKILKTNDSGETWSTQWQGPTGKWLKGIVFANNMLGIAVGDQILKTIDGGVSWTVCQIGNITGRFYRVACLDKDNYTAAGPPGILRTTDGGYSWFPQYNPNYPYPLTIAYSNYYNGVVLGIDKLLLRTTDSGNTWNRKRGTFVDKNLNATVDMGYLKFISVGDYGSIIVSTDTGINWNIENSGTTKNLYSICTIDETSAVVVGDSGVVLLTSDNGNSWQVQNSGVSSRLRGVSFPLGSGFATGYAVGDAGIILKTTDGGISWVPQNSGISEDLYSVYFVDVLRGYACGGHGKILNTTDGGAAWTVTQTSTIKVLRSISMYQQNTSYGNAVGENGTLLRTTNGGSTWEQQNIGRPYNFYDLAISNTDIGFFCADSGFIVRTTNRGAYWSQEENLSPVNLFSVAVANSSTNVGIAVGESGVIVRKVHANIPVELVSFTARIEGNLVILTWETATEINNHGFEIQRRVSNSWITVGFINGHGTTTEGHTYVYHDNILESGGSVAAYRLKQLDYDGSYEYSNEIEITFAAHYSLLQNYPNPFNPVTSISYQLPEKGFVTLKIFDILGEEVATLVNEEKEAGKYVVEFDGQNFTSGVYLYRIKAGNFTAVKKLVLVK